MSKYAVNILDAEFINHNVKRFILEKPPGYRFVPGQGTDVAINIPEWQHQFRAFTFTSLPEQNYLELIVKIYPERKGMTAQLGKTNANTELIITEPFGAIHYKGPGVFLAGGSGITPFLSIFRQLYKSGQLKGNRLIYSNQTVEDVICFEELQRMLGNDIIPFFSHENKIGFGYNRIDRNFIIAAIRDFSQFFYLCGPDTFVRDLSGILLDLGAHTESLVVEE